jgi:GNAT superfamily N-acetyltransferase
MALGFKSDELRRTITFEEDGKTVFHALRTLEEGEAQTAGAPLPTRRPGATPSRVAARSFELTLDQALAYSDLTFPDLRTTAGRRPLPEPLLATVLLPVSADGPATAGPPRTMPLAAAVSVLRPGAADGTAGAEVVSFVVRSGLRRRGLGKVLLGAVEAELSRRGVRAVEGMFRDSWKSADAVRALLASAGWSEPRLKVLLVATDFRMLEGEIFEERPVPEGYEIFPWRELSPDERREIVRRQQRGAWYPETLSPFHLEDRIDSEVSVGLRRLGSGEGNGSDGSRVIGWMIAHRVKDELVQYTSLFVEEGHGKLGRGLPLIAAAARRQRAAGVPRGIFMVQGENRAMRRLLERRMAPYLTERAELLASGKRLG